MTVFLLMIVITSHPSVLQHPLPEPVVHLVQSPEHAAVLLYDKYQHTRWGPTYTPSLYRIDLKEHAITEVAIPTLTFIDPGHTHREPEEP